MSCHTLPVGIDSLVAGLRCAACQATDVYAPPAYRSVSRRRVIADARKVRIYYKGFATTPPQVPLSKRGPVANRAVMRNTFGRDTPVSVPEVKDSVQSMIADVEKTLVELRAALESGSRREANTLKGAIKDGFATMTDMARTLQKMMVEQMEAETSTNGSLEELISLGKSMDSMHDQTVRIKEELNAMRTIVPVLPDTLSPEVRALVERVESLEWAAEDELSDTMPEVANSVQLMCQDLRVSLVRGDDASAELNSIVARMKEERSKSESEGTIAAFEAGSLAAFIDEYTSVFGSSKLVDTLEKEEIELKPLEELLDIKQNGIKDTQGADSDNVDPKTKGPDWMEFAVTKGIVEPSSKGASESPTKGVSEPPTKGTSTPPTKGVIEAPPAPPETTNRKPLGDFIPSRKTSAFVIDKIVDDAFRESHLAAPGGGGIDDNSNNGGGGGGGSGDDEEPLEASAVFWTILLLLIGYIMLLSLMLEAHTHVQKQWRQWWSHRRGEDEEEGGGVDGAEGMSGGDDGSESDGGGVSYGGGEPVLQRGGSAAAAMSMKSRALMRASVQKEPKTGVRRLQSQCVGFTTPFDRVE